MNKQNEPKYYSVELELKLTYYTRVEIVSDDEDDDAINREAINQAEEEVWGIDAHLDDVTVVDKYRVTEYGMFWKEPNEMSDEEMLNHLKATMGCMTNQCLMDTITKTEK